jgi:hypothetical protein
MSTAWWRHSRRARWGECVEGRGAWAAVREYHAVCGHCGDILQIMRQWAEAAAVPWPSAGHTVTSRGTL